MSKMEGAYLAILRVAILVAASLALLVTVIVMTAAAPSLLASAGIGEKSEESNGALRQFMEQQRTQSSQDDAGYEEPEAAAMTPLRPDIDVAAKNLAEYLGSREAARRREIGQALQQNADELATATQALGIADASDQYAASVRALSRDLLESTGRKLNEAKVWELIRWHHDRFAADLAASEAKRAAARADLMVKLGVAAGAFLAFVLIVFVFLFVKIERNLRGLGARDPVIQEEV